MKVAPRLQPLKGPVDLAPLADVVLLLLLFFLIGSTLVVHPGLLIQLPDRLHGLGSPADDRILVITAAGSFYFDDERTNLRRLRAQLEHYAATRPGRRIIVKADVAAPSGLLLDVLDLASRLGIETVIAAQRAEL